MRESHYSSPTHSWLRDGIFGAVANLIISGSSHFCFLWFASLGALSNRAVSSVLSAWLVFAVPFLLIGFIAGSVSYLKQFGKLTALFAALLGSAIGVFVSGQVLSYLETAEQISNDGYPVIRYAGWVALTVTVAGVFLAVVVIMLAGLIRKVSSGGK